MSIALVQVNVLMWAVQPALAGALNREFRLRGGEDEDEDRLYPVVIVRPAYSRQVVHAMRRVCTASRQERPYHSARRDRLRHHC